MAVAPAPERRVLQEIIFTIGSSLELDEVLGAIVRSLSDASGVHACFVYFAEDGGERLVLRAASDPYAHLAGKIALQRGEGLAWWVAERQEPAFIREKALADPRVKYVPELEEERFQSLCSVPIIGRAGVIGVISANTEAPRRSIRHCGCSRKGARSGWAGHSGRGATLLRGRCDREAGTKFVDELAAPGSLASSPPSSRSRL